MKIRNILLGLLAMVTLFACTPDAPVVKPTLEVSTSKMSFNSFGGERPLTITTNNAWTVAADVDWITFDSENGDASADPQQVMVYVDENKAVNTDPRTGKITVTSGGLTHEVEVSQSATEFVAELSVSLETLSAVAAGEALTFNVTSNVAWTVSSEAEWLTFSPASGEASADAATVTVTVAANDVEQARTATITVAGEGVEETISLTQEAKPLEPAEMEGDGSEANPYIIKTAAHMLSMRDVAKVDGTTYFRLANDVDMASVTNWVPVNFDGTYSRQIHFDGGNFTLSNFAPQTWKYTEDPAVEPVEETDTPAEPVVKDAGYHSLFGVLYGSVKNIKIDNVTIEGTNACGVIGGFVGTVDKPGHVENVTITNADVYNKGERVGIVAGAANGATFKNVSAQGVVKGDKQDAAGFVGKTQGVISMTDCSVKASVTSTLEVNNRCGGLIGWNAATDATLTNCHVLAGSTITDASAKTAKKDGCYGGLIGYGDSGEVVLKIKGCSVKAALNSGTFSIKVAGMIGTLGYSSTVSIEDSFVEAEISSGQNYVGGLVGYLGKSKLTVTGCHFDGAVAGASGVGGLVGGVEDTAVLTLSKSYSKGNLTSTANNSGGLVGLSSATSVISDSWSSMNLTQSGQFGGGIIGAGQTTKVVVTNCYSIGNIGVSRGSGGIAGLVKAPTSEVKNCLAWNPEIKTNRGETQYSPGAVIGVVQINGNYSSCFRTSAMTFTDVKMTLVDHDDVSAGMPPLPDYTSSDNNQRAYHGKASDKTLSAAAKELGWSEDIWDLSKDVPTLK